MPEDNKQGMPQATTASPDNATPPYSDDVKEAWAAAHKELPQKRGVERALDKIGGVQDTFAFFSAQQPAISTLAGTAMDTPQIAETIKKGVDTFMEAAPIIMKVLDEVAKAHPFIAVAVLAFKAVYTLETKRHENDNRIIALYAEMKDMMEVLINLNDVPDTSKIGPGGQTIKGRLRTLCEAIAKDIKKCANTCDAYLKKKLLVKIFAGPIWEGRLLEYVEIFKKKQDELKSAMMVRITIGVHILDHKLDNVAEQNAEVLRRMDIMSQLFRDFTPPQQKSLAIEVEKLGEKAALDSEEKMKELVDKEPALIANPGQTQSGGDRRFNFRELQQEIKADPDEAIKKNLDFFDRKFSVQQRQLEEVVRREGDRIISAVTAGPHDRILDVDIYNIWKDMGWRGSVKARHFVMALRDYYIEKSLAEPLPGPDRWAFKYINLGRARIILEAFDEDASGFITVSEVNTFTQSRPINWSLPHWIAYWAIGWQMTCTAYCTKIEEIFDAMIRLAYQVLPENRQSVEDYVYLVWREVTAFVQCIKREDGNAELKSKFESHVATEERRLQRNFEDFKYNIDGPDSVRVISGEGRIEMTLFPMLYLALKRGLEKISLAREYVLSKDEMGETATMIYSIANVASDRIESLRSAFEQQNLEPNIQFETFAKGLYNIRSGEWQVFDGEKLRDLPDPIPCPDELIPDPKSIPHSILNNPTGKRQEINHDAYNQPEFPVDKDRPVLGTYYGFMYRNGQADDPMMKFVFSRGEGENTFVGAGSHFRTAEYLDYAIAGSWSPPTEDEKVPVTFKVTYRDESWYDTNLEGVFDPEENSLKGTLLIPLWNLAGEFVFKRHPDMVRFYPSPSITDARKRWDFATMSVLDNLRRDAWSSKRISAKIKAGKRFMELALRLSYGRPWTAEEWAEFLALLPSFYEADTQLYASLIKIHLIKTTIYPGVGCDNCGARPIGGSRIICMDCRSKTTIDLCSECVDSTVTFKTADRKPHPPNHGMFKVYRFIFDRDMARNESIAKVVLSSARELFSDIEEGGEPMPECVRCKAKISLPCWACMDCFTGDDFICDNCESRQLAFNENHTKLHTMVRVTKGAEKERSTEDRLQFLEDKLEKIERILAKVAERTQDGPDSEPLTRGDLRAAVVEAESVQPEGKPAETEGA